MEELDNVDSEKSEESTPKESNEVEVENKEDVTESESNESESLEAVEKTPIDDDMRTKLKIPAKFKFWEDVTKWGSEAEKAKSRAESARAKLETDKTRYERELSEREEIIADLEKDLQDKVKAGSMSEEERNDINAKLQEELANNPQATFEKLFAAFERKLEQKQSAKGQSEKWRKEEDELKIEYGDDWDSTIKPELARIAAERPYLNSIKEVLAIYNYDKSKADKSNKAEHEAKKTEKKAAFAESGGGKGAATEDIFSKIANAKNENELERLTAKIPRKERS